MSSLNFDMQFVVWGQSYTDFFLNFVIPNYLSENNVPLTSKHYKIVCNIYTTPHDAEQIHSHAHYKKLSSYIHVEVIPAIIPSVLESKNKYSAKGFGQSLALKKAIANRSVALLLSPDVLIADGSLHKCCAIIEKGKKVVNVAGLKTEKEALLTHLMAYYNPQDCTLKIENRSLIDLGIRHLHEICKNMFWSGETFSNWPAMVLWHAPKKSVLAKFFHLHPLAIDLRNIEKKIPDVLMCADGGLLEYMKIRPHEIYDVTDSDEIACIELSSKFMDVLGIRTCDPKKKQASLLNFSFKYSLPTHIHNFMKMNVRFQGAGEVDWDSVENKVKEDLKPLVKALHMIKAFNHLSGTITKSLKSIAIIMGIRYLKRKIFN